ncbi:hypothetical protein EW146_g9433 [Bondarzewia mesenterica]|uniref:C2H2-type domain-containing protein n=1 Tax=Bondarzewia mesenterica TaxID=1095465 RepID=A0A4S4L6K6_9AGAM|nr:hypothetical protein EW146_g9433 [Bondarzewia mesenterica]
MPPRPSYRCDYCGKELQSDSAVKRHIAATRKCKTNWEQDIISIQPRLKQNARKHDSTMHPEPGPSVFDTTSNWDDSHSFVPNATPSSSKRARVEDVEDEDDIRRRKNSGRFVEVYPRPVGTPIGEGKTQFTMLLEEQTERGENNWAPFASEEEWQLSRWLSQRVGHKAIDEFLKLPIVRDRSGLSFHNSYSYLTKVDQLPTGPEWHCETIEAVGDQLGEDGKPMVENLELWFRDPVDCVKGLLSNPAFKNFTSYTPERVYSDKAGADRMFEEMWTGDWWWKTQDNLPDGAAVASIILSSDKTQLSVFQGDKSAWPVYLTLGNISKEVRRQPSTHAIILLGYLPVAKLECYKESTRSLAGYRLFHFCMSKILESLRKAGTDGVEITCGDGFIRLLYLILAAYVADYPEQCLVGCCMENRCPRCTVSPDNRGNYVKSLYRDPETTLEILEEHRKGGDPVKFDEYGLRAVYQPFWKDLPHCNIFQCFTPDLLHQLHKGMFKDHLVKWCTAVVGEAELDAHFKAMSSYPGLRHFKKGISFVTQWTGTEHKEMQKVFLGVLAGAVNAEVLTVARAVLDFIYYSQFQLHTSTTLAALEKCLKTFHEHKDIFIELGIREHFNIPKLHAILHYLEAIRSLGSLDGYNTESPEHLHIDCAKAAYRASNKCDYMEQMAMWLQRQEAMWLKESYLIWLNEMLPGFLNGGTNDESGGIDEHDGEDDKDEESGLTVDQPSVVDVASTVTISTPSWHVAKTPAFRGLSVEHLSTQFGAVDFMLALSTYLREAIPACPISPNSLDRFNVYRQLKLTLPANHYLSNQTRTNRIRTTPAVPSRGRKSATVGQFDIALVIEDREEYQAETDMQLYSSGLRPAQVRIIFDLPSQFGKLSHPLAYIEWFTPLGRPDPLTGMHIVKRSTRHHRRNAEVVSIHDLVLGCHLMAKCGNPIDKTFSTHNVLEKATQFFLNPYIHVDTFSQLK